MRVGRPRFEADFGEAHLPQEAGLRALAVSFSKGCYLGQEVVVTLEHRGKLRQVLVRLDAPSAPAPGAALVDAEGQTIGNVTTALVDPATGRALVHGYVKRAHAETGGTVFASGTPLRITGHAGAG